MGGTLALCFAQPAYAYDVLLRWTVPPNSDISEYRLYWGMASRTYGAAGNIDGAAAPTLNGVVYQLQSNLQLGVGYYFAVTACNAAGESDYSNEKLFNLAVVSPPRADAGPDQTGTVGDVLTLGSVADPGVSYFWRQTAGPPAILSERTSSRTQLNVGTSGTYVLALTAYDAQGVAAQDTVTVTVNTPSAMSTPTASMTPTNTAAPTATATRTNTATASATNTRTATSTPIPSATATRVPSATPTPTANMTPTNTAVPTATAIATNTATASPTNTRPATSTPTPSATATRTPSSTATPSPRSTSTPTATAVPTFTVAPTAIPTSTATPAPSVTDTPTEVPTPSATATPVPPSTATSTATATFSRTPVASATSTPTHTPTAMSSPTALPTFTPTSTVEPTATAVPSSTPTPEPSARLPLGITRRNAAERALAIQYVDTGSRRASGTASASEWSVPAEGELVAAFARDGSQEGTDLVVWKKGETEHGPQRSVGVYRIVPDRAPRQVAEVELPRLGGGTRSPTVLVGDVDPLSSGAEIVVGGPDSSGRGTLVCVLGGLAEGQLDLLSDFHLSRRMLGRGSGPLAIGDVLPDDEHTGMEIVAGGSRGYVRVLGLDHGRPVVLRRLRAFPDRPRASTARLAVGALIPTRPGAEIVVGDDGTIADGLVRLFDVRAGEPVMEFQAFMPTEAPSGVELWVADVLASAPGDELIVSQGPAGGGVRIFSLASGAPVRLNDLPDPWQRGTALRQHLAIGELLPDLPGNEIVVAQSDPRLPVEVFNMNMGTAGWRTTLPGPGGEGSVTAVAVAP